MLRGKKPEAIKKRLKLFMYGEPKAGKTTAAIKFPRPYLIDTEKGSENKKYTDILVATGGVVFNTMDFDEMIAEITALLTLDHEYKTLIIDPLTTVYNDLLDKCASKLKETSKEKDATGTEFGRHYGEANKKMKHLINLLLRLDMNVIITSHAKEKYGNGMHVIGNTFDCYKKLDYVFDLILEVQKRGQKRVAIVKGTRLEGFLEDEIFPFEYAEIVKRYDQEMLEKKADLEILATPEQVAQLEHLIKLLNVPEEKTDKWKDRAQAASFDEMKTDQIQSCINLLLSATNGASK